jgi:hypothetical protein
MQKNVCKNESSTMIMIWEEPVFSIIAAATRQAANKKTSDLVKREVIKQNEVRAALNNCL